MSRTKTTGKKLTPGEARNVAPWYMAAAVAHQHAAVWCFEHPAKLPNMDAVYFPTVSFELNLLSVEQSLRLVLLLHHSTVRPDINHAPHVLYNHLQNNSRDYEGPRSAIIERSTEYAEKFNIPGFTEKDVVACLKRHRASYNDLRYFRVDNQGKFSDNVGYSVRDVQLMHCLALGLIDVNMDKMQREKISFVAARAVPASEMTDELRALGERIVGKSPSRNTA